MGWRVAPFLRSEAAVLRVALGMDPIVRRNDLNDPLVEQFPLAPLSVKYRVGAKA